MPVRIPKYRRRKDRDIAFSEYHGKRTYFPGRYDSPESREAYGRFVQRLLIQQRALDRSPEPNPEGHSIAELVSDYLDHAKVYYLTDGKPGSEYHLIRSALSPLLLNCADFFADTFGPRDLRAVREAMIDLGWKRPTINDAVNRIRRMFRWAVEHELVPVEVWQALRAVAPLKRGRTTAEEGGKVEPVDGDAVDAVLPHLPAVVADMVRLQRLTGMRSESLCGLRPCDVDRSADVWLYRPPTHKTTWRERELVIPIGPQAQAVLAPYLENRPSDAFCFSPAVSEGQRSVRRRAERKSPMTPSQAARQPAPRRLRPPKTRYTSASYRRAVERAIDHLNAVRKKEGTPPVAHWHPHQLRHTVATEVRRKFGLEAAQVVLGHSQADVTQIYAERDLELARHVARKMG